MTGMVSLGRCVRESRMRVQGGFRRHVSYTVSERSTRQYFVYQKVITCELSSSRKIDITTFHHNSIIIPALLLDQNQDINHGQILGIRKEYQVCLFLGSTK